MSIYRRQSGRYAVLIDLEPTSTGLRRRKSIGTYRTRKEAESAERKALEARDRGIDLSPRAITVKELLDRFIADRRAKGRAIRTVARYEEIARVSIAPHLGGTALAKLSPAHVSTWLATLREQGSAKNKALSPKSVKHAYSLLWSALQWAVKHELAFRNVADAVDAPSVPRSQARALTDDEATRFFAVADKSRWGPFFRLALATGMRRGELLALRWSDVELAEVGASRITVSRAFVETPADGLVTKATKTERARVIPVGDLAAEALHRQWTLQAQDRRDAGASFADSGHVFQRAAGGPLAPHCATARFDRLRSKADVTATLHDLRHTAATWMLAGGIDIRTVSSVLGHSAPSTTLNIYAHVVAGAETRAVSAIDDHVRKIGA